MSETKKITERTALGIVQEALAHSMDVSAYQIFPEDRIQDMDIDIDSFNLTQVLGSIEKRVDEALGLRDQFSFGDDVTTENIMYMKVSEIVTVIVQRVNNPGANKTLLSLETRNLWSKEPRPAAPSKPAILLEPVEPPEPAVLPTPIFKKFTWDDAVEIVKSGIAELYRIPQESISLDSRPIKDRNGNKYDAGMISDHIKYDFQEVTNNCPLYFPSYEKFIEMTVKEMALVLASAAINFEIFVGEIPASPFYSPQALPPTTEVTEATAVSWWERIGNSLRDLVKSILNIH